MPSSASYVGVLSGATGTTIAEAFAPGLSLRPLGPVGDVNGDGKVDFLVVYLPTGATLGTVLLVSGSDGSVLGTLPNHTFGVCAPIGDIDGDGLGDFAMYSGNGPTDVYHGPGFNFAYSSAGGRDCIAPCGDIDQDGVPDYVVGHNGFLFPYSPAISPGWAAVVSGANGATIRSWNGPFLGSKFGQAAVGPGDLDLDGVPDVVVGAPGMGAVSLYAFSGATGAQLATYTDPLGAYDWFGTELVALGDVDGDGVGDFATRGHYVDVFSGATMTPIFHMTTNLSVGYPNGYYVGTSFAGLPDPDGDGFPELVIGAPAASAPGGHILCYKLQPEWTAVVGPGCPQPNGTVARIGCTGSAHVGSTFNINLSQVPSGRPAALILGLSNSQWGTRSLPWQIPPPVAPGCMLYESVDAIVQTTTTPLGPGGASGHAIATLQLPWGPTGTTFYGQWVVWNPPGSLAQVSLSGSMAFTLQ